MGGGVVKTWGTGFVWASHANSIRFANLTCVLEGLGIPPFGSPRGDRNWRIKRVDKK